MLITHDDLRTEKPHIGSVYSDGDKLVFEFINSPIIVKITKTAEMTYTNELMNFESNMLGIAFYFHIYHANEDPVKHDEGYGYHIKQVDTIQDMDVVYDGSGCSLYYNGNLYSGHNRVDNAVSTPTVVKPYSEYNRDHTIWRCELSTIIYGYVGLKTVNELDERLSNVETNFETNMEPYIRAHIPICGQDNNDVPNHYTYSINRFSSLKIDYNISTAKSSMSSNQYTGSGLTSMTLLEDIINSFKQHTLEYMILPGSYLYVLDKNNITEHKLRIKDCQYATGHNNKLRITFFDSDDSWLLSYNNGVFALDYERSTLTNRQSMSIILSILHANETPIKHLPYQYPRVQQVSQVRDFDIVNGNNKYYLYYNGYLYIATADTTNLVTLSKSIEYSGLTGERSIYRVEIGKFIPGYVSIETHNQALDRIAALETLVGQLQTAIEALQNA
jgi:hypothetical protein